MIKIKIILGLLISLALTPPAFSMTYKTTYPVPCSDLWPAVKDTLSNQENYEVVANDEAKMTASYNVKHAAHVTITGAALQRTNSVALSSQGTGCEMQVQSAYRGLAHDDAGDFKKRVDESLAKLKDSKPSQPAKPEAPAK